MTEGNYLLVPVAPEPAAEARERIGRDPERLELVVEAAEQLSRVVEPRFDDARPAVARADREQGRLAHLGRLVLENELVLEAREDVFEEHFHRPFTPRVALHESADVVGERLLHDRARARLDFIIWVVRIVFSLAFWSQAFAELKARSGSSFVGVVVLAVETAGLVLAVELLAAASPKGRNKKD